MSITELRIRELLAAARERGAEPGDFVLCVDIAGQELSVWHHGRELHRYRVSTGAAGVGSAPGSQRTPPGWHIVRDRHGLDEPLGRVFRSRLPEGEPLPPAAWALGDEDLILSRILRLAGLEPGLNDASYDRYIYIHGTNREDLLGQPASAGCVRMSNRDVAELFNLTLRHAVYCWIG